MSQQDRRREPYPWTLEPATAVCVILAAVIIVAVQLGRAAANAAAGSPLRFPTTTVGWLTSTPAVLTGHPSAGLAVTGGPVAGTLLLGWGVGVTIVLLLSLTGAGVVIGWRRFGPGVQGVASPGEVRATLGERRLYRNRQLLRPDLYRQNTIEQDTTETEAEE